MMHSRTFIIAEAGVNHNGSLDLAREMVDVASQAGADAIKFQSFKTEKIISMGAPKADYQAKATNSGESQFEMVKRLELDEESHYQLFEYCKNRGIQFLSTPFDFDSLDLLADKLDLPSIKIPSGEITNLPFLVGVGKKGKPVILSTGMSTIGEIEIALGAFAFGYINRGKAPSLEIFRESLASPEGKEIIARYVTLLHCTTEYPAPYEEVNLRAMDTLHRVFGLPVGLSDHSAGVAVSLAAVARGAAIIEKHFTLDKRLPGPDHQASLEPQELLFMIKSIRGVELALGTGCKEPTPSELKNRGVARKSLVAACDILNGETFTEKNLAVKRPGIGISPEYYWDWLGKKATKDYREDEMICE